MRHAPSHPAAAALLACLGEPHADAMRNGPQTVVVVAHPDDETIGAGARLQRLARVQLVYVTDGAPQGGADAARLGLCPNVYAERRRAELHRALQLGGLEAAPVSWLGYPDQQACSHIAVIAQRLARLFARCEAQAVLTHAYEGGHPDHDATALAVHAAAALVRRGGGTPPALVEMTSYHMGPHGIETGMFLPGAGRDEVTAPLTTEEQARKQAMLACFESQQGTLRYFRTDMERFRAAPSYDFTRPPHAGPLFYESQPWGMSSGRFLELAAAAFAQLEMEAQS